MNITITGSEGFVGKYLSSYLTSKGYDVNNLDLSLGHDLTNEDFVKEYFKQNKSDSLINTFALNHHIDDKKSKNSECSGLSASQYLGTQILAKFHVF